jgi:hypothetical protein
MLTTMFGARVDMLRRDPEDGSVSLDCDGKRFGLVLDYLRNGRASQVAKTIVNLPFEQHEAMLLELNFFGLLDAVFPAPVFKVWGSKLSSVRHCCAAVLQGRSIVVFGGFRNPGAALSTTEFLDLDAGPTAPSFSPGPKMATPRIHCAIVRLDAHRVLVVGGGAGLLETGILETTEILDFLSNSFSAGPTMLSRRSFSAVVVLDARRVIVAGGVDENGNVQRTTEILDLDTPPC